ncbi:MAG: hypothetical protein R3192_10795 [Woeseiaceae bacterium]|nr:hypothetical protein [Woeseiaceae bacterium]
MKIQRISRSLGSITILSSILFAVSAGHAQQTTERFIPIGQSPGISDKYSFIGEIVEVDAAKHTITLDSNRGRRTIDVTESTKIWLDSSGAKRKNTIGSYEDCQVGRRVEVMHLRDDESVADWIKIESP